MSIASKISEIQRAAGRHFGVTLTEILGPQRSAVIVRARHVAIYLAARHTFASTIEIGELFGGRYHTTVIHAVRRISALIRDDAQIADAIAMLERAIVNEPCAERSDSGAQVASAPAPISILRDVIPIPAPPRSRLRSSRGDVTAAICGDPPPERSALSQKRGAA